MLQSSKVCLSLVLIFVGKIRKCGQSTQLIAGTDPMIAGESIIQSSVEPEHTENAVVLSMSTAPAPPAIQSIVGPALKVLHLIHEFSKTCPGYSLTDMLCIVSHTEQLLQPVVVIWFHSCVLHSTHGEVIILYQKQQKCGGVGNLAWLRWHPIEIEYATSMSRVEIYGDKCERNILSSSAYAKEATNYQVDMLLKQPWPPPDVQIQNRWGTIWEKTRFLLVQMELVSEVNTRAHGTQMLYQWSGHVELLYIRLRASWMLRRREC